MPVRHPSATTQSGRHLSCSVGFQPRGRGESWRTVSTGLRDSPGDVVRDSAACIRFRNFGSADSESGLCQPGAGTNGESSQDRASDGIYSFRMFELIVEVTHMLV